MINKKIKEAKREQYATYLICYLLIKYKLARKQINSMTSGKLHTFHIKSFTF